MFPHLQEISINIIMRRKGDLNAKNCILGFFPELVFSHILFVFGLRTSNGYTITT